MRRRLIALVVVPVSVLIGASLLVNAPAPVDEAATAAGRASQPVERGSSGGRASMTSGTVREGSEERAEIGEAAGADLPPAPPVRNAAALRDALFRMVAAQAPDSPAEVMTVWERAYPDLPLSAFALKATPRNLSVYAGPADPSLRRSRRNPDVVAVAVADRSGRCAGGVVVMGRTRPRRHEVDLAEAWGCTAIEAGLAAGYPIG